MDNFYAGACVNTALAVGILCSLAGIIFVSLSITVGCLAHSRNKLREENECVNDVIHALIDDVTVICVHAKP